MNSVARIDASVRPSGEATLRERARPAPERLRDAACPAANSDGPLGPPRGPAPAAGARRRTAYEAFGKRGLDVGLALLALLAVAPAILLLAALVALSGARPFFGHLRVGRGGRTFRCWKLTTMTPDAEARLERLLDADPAAAAEWRATQKLSCDPRVTPFGAMLRRTSLDEIPQFWNVLVGDMSLVGPRPVTAAEVARYGEAASAYLAARPGLTGPWQVSGRLDATFAERVALDEAYLRDVSLRRDLRLLARTVPAVLGRTGR